MLLNNVNSTARCTANSIAIDCMAMEEPRENAMEQWQIEDAERLRKLFDNRQPREGEKRKESQEKFGARCGIGTQGAVWQYLKPKRPLNLAALLKFSRGLEVDPQEISPTLAAQLPKNHSVLTGQDPPTKSEPYDFKKLFEDDKDGYLDSLMYCWDGLSDGHKDALSRLANTLYEMDRPDDPRAGPKRRRRSDKRLLAKQKD